MDLRAQFASIWLRRGLVLLLALAAALAVFVIRSRATPEYGTTLTLQVIAPADSSGSPGGSADAEFSAATVVGLAGTRGVIDDVANRSELGLTSLQVQDRITVTNDKVPGFLVLEATGPSPAAARALAAAMPDALSARIERDEKAVRARATAGLREQAADLDQQLTDMATDNRRRSALEERYASVVGAITTIDSRQGLELLIPTPRPAAVPELISPRPLRDAGLAFLLGLILAAEGVVVLRAIRGRLPESDPAGHIQRELGVHAVELDGRQDPVAALAPLYQMHLRGEQSVTLLQLTSRRSRDLGPDLVSAATAVGDRVRHVDLYVGDLPHIQDGEPVVRSLRPAKLDGAVLGLMRKQTGPLLLAVDTASTGLRQLGHDLDALRAVGADVVAVLVWRGSAPGGRRPSRRLRRARRRAAVRLASGTA